ncbi:hypothetical protein H009_14708 [Agrobacterium tumefaciens str. Cherry 2E-2-2]|nr:hypothetical protein H009_14708 [Agrobacterium tumefaciens str. Cherry 2E-2-2]
MGLRELSFFMVTLVASTLAAGYGSAQSFSCPIGKRAACLDYGDKVVDGSAQCFNSYTCDFRGFMCKSDHDTYVKKAKALLEAYDGLKACISRATTVEDAKSCNIYY